MSARGLDPGSCRITLADREPHIAQHLINIAMEQPARFGGINEDFGCETFVFPRACKRLQQKLAVGGPLVLTRHERELLHTVLAEALANPEDFGCFPGTAGSLMFRQAIFSIQRKLPRRFSGTYEDIVA